MSKIEWTDETWNPSIGCRRVSEGCRNCYAEQMAARIVNMQHGAGRESPYEDVTLLDTNGNTLPRWNGRAVFLPDRLDQPLRWRKPRRVFVNSMSDLFHEDLTFEQIAAVFGVMAACPRHTFQVLTKRPERAVEFFEWLDNAAARLRHPFSLDPHAWRRGHSMSACALKHGAQAPVCEDWPLPNVWLGVSCEDQATADDRIPVLLRCPAAVRFVSAEPLLAPIDLTRVDERLLQNGEVNQVWDVLRGRLGFWGNARHEQDTPSLDWVIVGGESGPGARPCDVSWIRSIVGQCRKTGVAVFVKQLGTRPELKDRKGGDPDEWPGGLCVREWPDG